MIADDIDTLHTRFVNEWDEAVTAVFDNQPNVEIDPDDAWVRFAVKPGPSRHGYGSAQTGKLRRSGIVVLEIFVPAQQGDASAYELAEDFEPIFQHWRSADSVIRCDTATITPIGLTGDGWFQLNVTVPWESTRAY